MAGRNYTALGYCDETDIENFLLLDIDSSFSKQLEDWIAAAENYVNQYTGYTTASGVLLETITNENAPGRVDSENNLIVFPRKTPISSVQGITLVKGTSNINLVLDDDSGNTRYNLPPANDYIFYPNGELSTSGASVIRSFGDIRTTRFFSQVDYVGGYAEVPADIRMAAVNVTSDMVMRHANKEGLESITQGRVTKRWRQRYSQAMGGESDFILDAHKLLNNYRIASRWI